MNDEQTPALRQAVENMANMREAYDNLSQAAEAYNVGKTQLAAAITSKGVETSPTETYPEMAKKVNAISQETYKINGGEMYAKQLFGSLETPNYWNLYDILAQLLSDGRLVNYGGILLAEYYKGYDSLALSGAGSGGAYVVSDKDENGQFKMYTEDTTHTWAKEFDGYGDRWVAYCFADENHSFQITDTKTSPRTIFIGRKVGMITSLVNGRCSQIVVPDGNSLVGFNTGTFTQQWDKRVVFKNISSNITRRMITNPSCESIFIQTTGDIKPSETIIRCSNSNFSIIVVANKIYAGRDGLFLADGTNNTSTISCACLVADEITYRQGQSGDCYVFLGFSSINEWYVKCEKLSSWLGGNAYGSKSYHLGYITNDKSRPVGIYTYYGLRDTQLIELQEGWCKPLNIATAYNLSKDVVQTYIFDRLGVNDLSTGAVTITLANAVLALFTQEEIDAVVARTNITIVGA